MTAFIVIRKYHDSQIQAYRGEKSSSETLEPAICFSLRIVECDFLNVEGARTLAD